MSEGNGNGALYLFGISRTRGWRGIERRSAGLERVRYRDLEAVVKQSAFELPADHDAAASEHQRVLDGLIKRSTVLPMPVGVLFKNRRALIRMMQEEYLIIDEGLSLLDGNWEMRLHITCKAVGEVEDALEDEAMRVYAELRRFAKAAVPFPKPEDKLASVAFLVDRMNWPEFVERIEDFAAHHGALNFDVTGPWPAYDFVRVVT